MADDVVLDLLSALLNTTPGDRALREAHRLDEAQRTQEQRIALLTVHVASLQRTVATLTDALVRNGTLHTSDQRAIVRAARRPHEDHDAGPDSTDVDNGDSGDSPYRGSSPMRGTCNICRKVLGADEPELTLASRGKACTACFTRGG